MRALWFMALFAVLALATVGCGSQESQQPQETIAETQEPQQFQESTEEGTWTITLKPGWNSVSLPAIPVGGDINSVIATSEKLTIIRHDPKGLLWAMKRGGIDEFVGTLTTLDALGAYWILAERPGEITVKISVSASGETEVPPTISLGKGWNHVPVVTRDIGVRKIDPDTYFFGLPWKVVWVFDPPTELWTSITPEQIDNPQLEVGRGYWVFLKEAGVLRP